MKSAFEDGNFFVLVQDHALKQGRPVSDLIKALNRKDHNLLGVRRLRSWGPIVNTNID